MRKTAPFFWYDESGAYIRGAKPADAASNVPPNMRRAAAAGSLITGTPVFSPIVQRCTGAAPAGAQPLALLAIASVVWFVTRGWESKDRDSIL